MPLCRRGQGLPGKVSSANRKFVVVSKSEKAENLVLQKSVQKHVMSFPSAGKMRNMQKLTYQQVVSCVELTFKVDFIRGTEGS